MTGPTKTARLVRVLPVSPTGADQRLYRLSPPLASEPWGDEQPTEYEYVVVSAVVAPFSGPETYVFGADESGEIQDWCELPGSFRGGLDHEAALTDAGYTVVDDPTAQTGGAS